MLELPGWIRLNEIGSHESIAPSPSTAALQIHSSLLVNQAHGGLSNLHGHRTFKSSCSSCQDVMAALPIKGRASFMRPTTRAYMLVVAADYAGSHRSHSS